MSTAESHVPELEFIPARPAHQTILVTVGSAVAGPMAGSLLARVLLADGVFSEALGFFALPLAFGFGYKVWVARVASIAMKGFVWGLLRTVFRALFLKQKPDRKDILPDRAAVANMLHQVRAAAGVFRRIGWAMGFITGCAAVPLAAEGQAAPAFLAFFLCSGLYGTALARLAKAGYLPLPEEL